MNRLAVIIIFCLSSLLFESKGIAQEKKTTIEWLTWEEAIQKNELEERKIFVDIYTDWCGWCKKMDKSTFEDPAVVAYMNKHYYAVKFNAEQKETILFKDKEYNFVSSGRRGYHELAFEIAKGRLGYPTFVFLDEKAEVIQPISGFKEARVFEMIMSYFGSNSHTRIPWAKYQEEYQHK